jgi:hypothetical protein
MFDNNIDIIIEFVVSELMCRVGWGAQPKRLALLPELRRLAGVKDETPLKDAGNIVRGFLLGTIDALSDSYEFQGRSYDASLMKRCFRVLLRIEAVEESAPRRRGRVIVALKIGGSHNNPETWRRPDGPARDFLRILALALVERGKPNLRQSA